MDMNEVTKYLELPEDVSSIRPEVLKCLVEGLQFLKGGAVAPVQKLANRILANIIIEHLEISGFCIHRKTAPDGLQLAPENACAVAAM